MVEPSRRSCRPKPTTLAREVIGSGWFIVIRHSNRLDAADDSLDFDIEVRLRLLYRLVAQALFLPELVVELLLGDLKIKQSIGIRIDSVQEKGAPFGGHEFVECRHLLHALGLAQTEGVHDQQ